MLLSKLKKNSNQKSFKLFCFSFKRKKKEKSKKKLIKTFYSLKKNKTAHFNRSIREKKKYIILNLVMKKNVILKSDLKCRKKGKN